MKKQKVVLPPQKLLLPRRELLVMGLSKGLGVIVAPAVASSIIRAALSLATVSMAGVAAQGCGSSSGGSSSGSGGGGTQTKTLYSALVNDLRAESGHIITLSSPGQESGFFVGTITPPGGSSQFIQFKVDNVMITQDVGTVIVRTGQRVKIYIGADPTSNWAPTTFLTEFTVR